MAPGDAKHPSRRLGLGSSRPSLGAWVVATLGATGYASLLVALRGRPTIKEDSGIFLSVTAGLVHGDRLYTGVWDNKPPFFYYADALAYLAGGWRGPFLIDVVWVALAVIGMWRLLVVARAGPATVVAGTVVYPLMLTGAWYFAGYSELPALALAPLVGWCWLAGWPVATGALLGVVAFLRPDYALIFAALIIAPVVVLRPTRSELGRSILRLTAGFAAVALLSVGVLLARGELTGYFHTMTGNVGYEDQALQQSKRLTGFGGHLRVAWSVFGGNLQRTVLAVLVLSALAAVLLYESRAQLRRRPRVDGAPHTPSPIGALAVGTAIAAFVTLGLTALWVHSLELVALPATFATCALVATVEASATRRWIALGATAAIAVVGTLAFGGLSLDSPASPQSAQPFSNWRRAPYSVSALVLDAAAAKVPHQDSPISYARLGINDDDGHGAFIDGNLKLACPRFHQYPFSARLGQVVTCLRRRKPDLILVGAFFIARGWLPWNEFVSESRGLLRARYREVVNAPDDGGRVTVWERRASRS